MSIKVEQFEDLDFPVCWETPPTEILKTIETAEEMFDDLRSKDDYARVPSLVNSNYYIAYHALRHALVNGYATDKTFCEWGSGLGVVTCIASQLGYKAVGIEIESSLVDFARSLALRTDLKAHFIQGSYRRSQGSEAAEGSVRNDEAPFPIGNHKSQVMYVYPWPAEVAFVESLFLQSASETSVLISFHGGKTLQARRRRTPGTVG